MTVNRLAIFVAVFAMIATTSFVHVHFAGAEQLASVRCTHQCFAVGEPENPSQLEAASACLDRADWPELAEGLRKRQLSPTPQTLIEKCQTPDTEK